MHSSVFNDFISLINGKYPHVIITRGDDFAPYDDFEERYLKQLSEKEKEQLFIDVYNHLLGTKEELETFFWLSNSFFPAFRYRSQKYLTSGRIVNNREALKQYME